MNGESRYQLRFIRTLFGFILFIICQGSSAAYADSVRIEDQLLMITSDSCPWCEAFEEEVGSGYALTRESALFPLKRVDHHQAMPVNLQHITPAVLTPTFVIIQNGSEIGRIVGYPGAELFWWRISEFIQFESK